jgi:hypothetical protein
MTRLRRRPAHFAPIERHNTPVILLVTVCSQFKRSIFVQADSASVIVNAWMNAPQWQVIDNPGARQEAPTSGALQD